MFWQALTEFIGGAGAVIDGVGKLLEGNAAAKAANFNKNISRFNANTTRQNGAIEEARVRREAQRRIGQMRANAGASGLDGGTIDDLLSESMFEAEMDALTTRYNYRRQAEGYDMEAEMYGEAGGDARMAGYVGAASSLLRGVTDWYGRNADTSSGRGFKLGGGSGNYSMYNDGITIRWDN